MLSCPLHMHPSPSPVTWGEFTYRLLRSSLAPYSLLPCSTNCSCLAPQNSSISMFVSMKPLFHFLLLCQKGASKVKASSHGGHLMVPLGPTNLCSVTRNILRSFTVAYNKRKFLYQIFYNVQKCINVTVNIFKRWILYIEYQYKKNLLEQSYLRPVRNRTSVYLQ